MTTRSSSLGAIVTATAVGVGFTVVAIVLFGIYFRSSLQRSLESRATTLRQSDEFVPEVVDFKKDGTPFIFGHNYEKEWHSQIEYHDLNDQEIEVDFTKGRLKRFWFTPRNISFKHRYGWSNIIQRIRSNEEPPINWFFIHDGCVEGRGYFVGYDATSSNCIGYLGLFGFTEQPLTQGEQFPVGPAADGIRVFRVDLNDYLGLEPLENSTGSSKEMNNGPTATSLLVCSQDAVYRVDLVKREVTPIYKSPESEVISVSREGDYLGHPLRLGIRTERQVTVFSPTYEMEETINLPEPLWKATYCSIGHVSDGTILATTGDGLLERYVGGLSLTTKMRVYRFNKDGTLLSTQEIDQPVLPLDPGSINRWDSKLFFAVLGGPLPMDFGLFFLFPIMSIIHGYTYSQGVMVSGEAIQLGGFGGLWLTLILYHLSTLLWAFLAWRRETKYHSSPGQRWMWTLFVYLLGLPALMGYLAHRKWPRLDECPCCKTHVPVDHDNCMACGNEWPLPARNGIEVIEA